MEHSGKRVITSEELLPAPDLSFSWMSLEVRFMQWIARGSSGGVYLLVSWLKLRPSVMAEIAP